MARADVIVVGGGIVGLATAFQIQQRSPGRAVHVLEKEPEVGRHQTGHNSGVLHTGVYYRPGSAKALNCRDGRAAMVRFCEEQGVAHEICGKVIVATAAEELPRLEALHERAQANGVRCEAIPPERLAELEPAARGIRALHVRDAGIVDYGGVVRALLRLIRERGGRVETGVQVGSLREAGGEVIVGTDAGERVAGRLVNCAGLHSDRVAREAGGRPELRIVPFRGEYYRLKPDAAALCRNLIYPVPDPAFPFLGVHFTRMIGGDVEAGPNAVLALAREGYRKTTLNLRDALETLTYPGFLRLARRYWRVGAGEMWRSVSKAAFVRALQRLVPALEASQLEAAPAGVRAQAVARDGTMLDDFRIESRGLQVHVLNAPSPAATASLNIGLRIAELVD